MIRFHDKLNQVQDCLILDDFIVIAYLSILRDRFDQRDQ